MPPRLRPLLRFGPALARAAIFPGALSRLLPLVLATCLLGSLGPAPLRAIVFSSGLIYGEDFSGETALPTTPETDALGAGGLYLAPLSGLVPTFTGSSAHLLVTVSDIRSGVEVDIDDEQYSTAEFDVGLRGNFSGLTFSDEGEARLVQAIRFTLDDDVVPGGTNVASFVQLIKRETFEEAVLWVLEEQVGPNAPPDYLDFLTLNLPQSTAAQIFAGASFTVDLEVDRDAATARAAITVGSDPEIAGPALPLAFAQHYSVSSARQYIDHRSVIPMTIELDLDDFSLHADPQVFLPLFNIDVGSFWGTPTPTYAGAGDPGYWNPLTIGSNTLADLTGLPTTTTALLTAASLGLIEANGGETRDLLADWARDPLGWSVGIANLPSNGAYRVTFYSLGLGAANSGTLFANGETHPSLPGVVSPTLVEGESFGHIETLVTGGQLDLAGMTTGGPGPIETHLSGLQIEHTVPLPEPGFGMGLGIVWVGLMVIAKRRPGA